MITISTNVGQNCMLPLQRNEGDMTVTEQRQFREPRYLAIDGGGTKTAFLLADTYGNPIKTVVLGASNPNDVGMENTKEVLRQGIQTICGDACNHLSVYAGIAGARTGDNQERLHRFLGGFGFRSCLCGSDIDSLIAMGDHQQQIFMILGTGIIAFAKSGDKVHRVAGWGQLFDGAGSAYDLGRDAICAALYAADGTGPKTMLTELLERDLGESPVDHLAKFYSGGKRYIAGFAHLVFEARGAGDTVSDRILKQNMEHVVDIIRAAAAKLDAENIEVLLTGGLINAQFDVIEPILREKLGAAYHLELAKQPPIYGALRLAMKEEKSC